MRSGTSIEKIGTHLAQEAEQKRYGFPQMPKTPEEFRRELYIQVINADMNEELLKNVVHDTMGMLRRLPDAGLHPMNRA